MPDDDQRWSETMDGEDNLDDIRLNIERSISALKIRKREHKSFCWSTFVGGSHCCLFSASTEKHHWCTCPCDRRADGLSALAFVPWRTFQQVDLFSFATVRMFISVLELFTEWNWPPSADALDVNRSKANNLDDDIQSEQQLHLVVSEEEKNGTMRSVLLAKEARASTIDARFFLLLLFLLFFKIVWRDNEHWLEDPTSHPSIHQSPSLSIYSAIRSSFPPPSLVFYFLAIEVCCNSLFAYEGRLHSFACMCVVRRKEQAIVMSSRKRNWINYNVREHSSLSLDLCSLAFTRSLANGQTHAYEQSKAKTMN